VSDLYNELLPAQRYAEEVSVSEEVILSERDVLRDSRVFLFSLCQSVSALNAISITTLGLFTQTIMGSIGDLPGLSDGCVWHPENSFH